MTADHPLILDTEAPLARKPSAAPLVSPHEAVAIALSMVQWMPGRLHGPDDAVVDLILKAVHQAGWRIVPR